MIKADWTLEGNFTAKITSDGIDEIEIYEETSKKDVVEINDLSVSQSQFQQSLIRLNKFKKLIPFGIVAIVIAFIILGNPSTLNLGFFTWDLNQDGENEGLYNTNETSVIYISDFFSINNLEPRKEIYKTNEEVTVDFDVQYKRNNPYPYNITVSWIHNNKTYYEWMHESNESGKFYSFYNGTSQGIWETQVVLNWEYSNETYSKGEVTSFRVI